MRNDKKAARAATAGRWLSAGLLALAVAGCAGYQKEQLHQKYAGASVADKKIVSKTRYEPIRIVSYVLPNGQIICEGEYGEIRVSCAMQKAQIEKKYNIKVREFVRDSGQTRPVQYDEHYLVLKHPDGTVSTQQVSEAQFSQSLIGERLGLSSTDPAARRAALTTEIAGAETDLATTAAQVEAKEAEKERAMRGLAASKRPAKGSNKGGSAVAQSAETELTRLTRLIHDAPCRGLADVA
ncbi:hypothetical protein DF3PA_460001 [Candidatus Defluviicoccus seviourii]|uniref:Lipoprotein n=1 Tax=Candidatus Defluviicoccus seviourii TaxID=2565273 RepID=A0A564WGA9_9PROT|nr:hypothetical protein DF3PA_460001 [Candidatus Defluviicoccus seviourii]